jgi:hypothetical protein
MSRRDQPLLILVLFVHFFFHIGFAAAQEKIRIAPSSPGLAAWPIHLAA